MIRNLVFDLDGTLFDSLPSIERTARVAVSRALPEMSPPDLRSLVGPPIAKMFADSRVSRIYGGTNEIMRVIVAQSLGL